MWVKRVLVATGAVFTANMHAVVGRFGVPVALGLVLVRSVQAQPAAPASLTALSGNAQVFLQWPASSGATSYNIYRAPTNRAYALITNVTATSYTDSTVANGVGYYYVVAALGGGRGGANSPEAAAIPLAPGYHRFINRLSGMALDNPNGNGSGGVDQQPYGGINQLWSLVPLGGGVFASLDAKGTALSGQTPSAQLTMNPYLGASYQFWTFQVTNDTYYLVRNLYTGQVLDDFGGSTTGGTAVGQWAPTGGNNQNWIVTQPLPQLSATITNNGNYAQYTFTGQVDPNHLDTTVICELGASASYGYYATNFIAGTNTGAVGFTNVITIPQPTSFIPTWHAAVTASNLAGSVSTGDTAMAAPVTQLLAVTLTNAAPLPQYVFTGVLNPAGLDTTVICQLGTNTSYDTFVTNVVAATNGPVNFSFTIPRTMNRVTALHGQVTAQNATGTNSTSDLTVNSVGFEVVMCYALGNYVGEIFYTDTLRWVDANDDGYLDLAGQGAFPNGILGAFRSDGGVIYNPMLNFIFDGYYNGPGNNQWFVRQSMNAYGGGRDGVLLADDLNGDNIPDMLWAGSAGDSVLGNVATYPAVTYGRSGSPAFDLIRNATPYRLPDDTFYPDHPRAVAGDLDHSGSRQILLCSGAKTALSEAGTDRLLRNAGLTSVSGGPPAGVANFQEFDTLDFINNWDADYADFFARGIGCAMAAGFLSTNGFPDIYAYRCPTGDQGQATVYRNDGEIGFTPVTSWAGVGGPSDRTDLTGGANAVWADFNGDGLDDLLTIENSSLTVRMRILFNDGQGHFTNSNWVLPQTYAQASLAVADLFNHGRPDIVMTGETADNYSGGFMVFAPLVLRNDGNGVFTPVDFGFYPAMSPGGAGGVALGDYDKDGRLDIAIAGSPYATFPHDSVLDHSPAVYRNELNIPSNAPPTAPTGLGSTVSPGRVALRWGDASDDITPVVSLTYNLRIGTTPLGTDICPPLANVTNGWRKVADRGNVGHCLGTWYKLPPGTYYWSVQAIDGAFAGGAWAAEQTFTITAADQPELSFFGDTTNSLVWPSRFTGYHLEQTTDLGSGVWSTNSNQVLDSFNGKWRVTVSNAPGSSMFYRLRK